MEKTIKMQFEFVVTIDEEAEGVSAINAEVNSIKEYIHEHLQRLSGQANYGTRIISVSLG